MPADRWRAGRLSYCSNGLGDDLAFLGLGVAPPSSEWGALLDAGRLFITTSWWLEILPGLVIVVVAIAVTSLGRTLQHRLEGAAR